jgi:hypothetical protein
MRFTLEADLTETREPYSGYTACQQARERGPARDYEFLRNRRS